MIESRTADKITKTVDAIKQVGLHECCFSIEPELAPKLVAWAIDQGWTVEEADWNNPESLYIGEGTGLRPLTVLTFKF